MSLWRLSEAWPPQPGDVYTNTTGCTLIIVSCGVVMTWSTGEEYLFCDTIEAKSTQLSMFYQKDSSLWHSDKLWLLRRPGVTE